MSADGAAWLALFATPSEQEPIGKHMNTVAFMDSEQITRLHGEENWIEVSGLKADRIRAAVRLRFNPVGVPH